ncbi:MAG: bifunctional glutamate N-acetyltransferase/amino-acid acetyltransferase ArgJ [Anaerolineae bacterium]|nr:bifunctional glutamate N-acetyltransferase/amino-acid acetyltransferase ArgJ [Anaerolineae bacterium]
MASVSGFSVSGVHAGLKANGELDMALIFSDNPCAAAGVFTTNLMKAAPVLFDIQQLASNNDDIRAVVVNTKCANACTGEQGLANAREMAQLTANLLGLETAQVLVMSTGVIGTHLPMQKIAHGIELGANTLGQDWDAASRGIMTTDTRPKLASESFDTPSGKVTLTGIAKGAGMIAPNMATLLSVVVTDAVLSPEQTERLLKQSVEPTFNRIVVDGDMSTNDTLLLLANGASGVSIAPNFEAQFADALLKVCRMLAQAIVRDGEGATKFITLHVKGAANDAAAKQIANAIATSPLVKTAFYGGDANWGRIVAAAGRSGVNFGAASVKLRIAAGETLTNDLLLFENEMPTQYSEELATAIVKSPEVYAQLEVGQGVGEAIVYTCDLSHDYVSINGSYRS